MISRRIRPSRTASFPAGRPLRAVPGIRGDQLVMPAQREFGPRIELTETVHCKAREIGVQQRLVLARRHSNCATETRRTGRRNNGLTSAFSERLDPPHPRNARPGGRPSGDRVGLGYASPTLLNPLPPNPPESGGEGG
jgi:hypothetical protein